MLLDSPNYIAPKIFISYSWTSDEYADWVMKLAERLVDNGVDVVLDRWDLKLGQDKFVFMEQMVTNPEIKKVLIMCDKRYAERADKREGGVGTESTIISQEVYNQVNQEKFIPVITERAPNGDAYIPTFIKSRIYTDLSDIRLFERGYEDLWRAVTGRPAAQKPALGTPPAYLLETNRPTASTTFALRAFESALMSDKRHSTGLAQDYLDRLLETLASFQIDLTLFTEEEKRDSRMLECLEEWTPFRKEFVSFLQIVCRYGTDQRLFELLPTFFEASLKLTRPMNQHQWTDHLRFIVHEAFLYCVTVLMQASHFDAVSLLLDFHYRDPERTQSTQRYGIFTAGDERYLHYLLNQKWQQETGQQWKYPQQVWLQERVEPKLLSFDSVKETDIILWLRYNLERDPNNYLSMHSWYPMTTGSIEDMHWRPHNLPLFQRASSKRYFDQFKVILGVDSKEDFLQRLERAFSKRSDYSGDGMSDYWNRVFNIKDLASTN